jgi:hypothetical protein
VKNRILKQVLLGMEYQWRIVNGGSKGGVNIVDVLYVPIANRTVKPVEIILSKGLGDEA